MSAACSEHFFGLGRGKVPVDVASRVDAIARRHGATFVHVTLPGDGPRYWYACPNRGNPFDRDTEQAVLADVAAAGIVLPRGRS